MPDAEDHKTPLDALLELGLYAPLGLALEARDRLPDLIARGRQQVTSQVTLARMMGQYAVREGEKDARKRWSELEATLRGLGLLPEANPPGAGAPAAGTMPTPPPETVVSTPSASAASAAPSASNGSANGSASSANGKAASSSAEEPAVRARADLAIPGYDTLSASQVVQRLGGLSADELEAVRDYESGTRGRRTILSKIASLQSDTSS
jgi:hypothetical protein